MGLRDTLLDDMVGRGVQNKGRIYGVDTAMRVDVFRFGRREAGGFWIVVENSYYTVGEDIGGWFEVGNVELTDVFYVERWLEVFSEDITCVGLTGHSPNPHFAIYVILTDDMMANVNGSGVFIHVRLCSDVFGGLVVGVEEIVWVSISIEL